MAEDKKVNIVGKINLFIALLGVFAPAGYLVGLSYYQGTLEAYGINYDAFPLNTQDIYVNAYFAIGYSFLAITSYITDLFKYLFTPPNLYWVAAIFISTVLFIYFIIKRKKFLKIYFLDKWKYKIRKIFVYLHWENNDFTKAFGFTSIVSYVFLIILYMLMILSVFWFAIPLVSYYKGLNVAEQQRDQFIEKGCYTEKDKRWSNCKSLKKSDGDLVYKGILVTQSKDRMAFFTKDGTYVVNVPKGGVIINEISPKTNKLDTHSKD